MSQNLYKEVLPTPIGSRIDWLDIFHVCIRFKGRQTAFPSKVEQAALGRHFASDGALANVDLGID